MRVTRFVVHDDEVMVIADLEPALVPEAEWAGQPLHRVSIHHIEDRGPIELQLVEIRAGGAYPMHSSPKLAFCHIVYGAGTLGLPDGREVSYRGPETYVFHPHALHDWHSITEDTLLAVAIIPDAAERDAVTAHPEEAR